MWYRLSSTPGTISYRLNSMQPGFDARGPSPAYGRGFLRVLGEGSMELSWRIDRRPPLWALDQFDQNAMGRAGMNERHPGAVGPFPWRFIDETEPRGASASQRSNDVGHRERQVMNPFPPGDEEPVQWTTGREGLQELDPHLRDFDERHPDILLAERLPPDLGQPKSPVERDGVVDPAHDDAEVGQPSLVPGINHLRPALILRPGHACGRASSATWPQPVPLR